MEKDFCEIMKKEFQKERDEKIRERIKKRIANAKNFDSEDNWNKSFEWVYIQTYSSHLNLTPRMNSCLANSK